MFPGGGARCGCAQEANGGYKNDEDDVDGTIRTNTEPEVPGGRVVAGCG